MRKVFDHLKNRSVSIMSDDAKVILGVWAAAVFIHLAVYVLVRTDDIKEWFHNLKKH